MVGLHLVTTRWETTQRRVPTRLMIIPSGNQRFSDHLSCLTQIGTHLSVAMGQPALYCSDTCLPVLPWRASSSLLILASSSTICSRRLWRPLSIPPPYLSHGVNATHKVWVHSWDSHSDRLYSCRRCSTSLDSLANSNFYSLAIHNLRLVIGCSGYIGHDHLSGKCGVMAQTSFFMSAPGPSETTFKTGLSFTDLRILTLPISPTSSPEPFLHTDQSSVSSSRYTDTLGLPASVSATMGSMAPRLLANGLI